MAKKNNSLYSDLRVFLAVFAAVLLLLVLTLDPLSSFYRTSILLPVSYSGYAVLSFFGVPAAFSGPLGIPGFCEYRLPHYILQVTFGCTGIYALFILLAVIAAFPRPVPQRITGMLISIPLFYVYSIVRLVIIGFTGYWIPDYIHFVHSFLMEIINIVFVMTVFIVWIRYAGKALLNRLNLSFILLYLPLRCLWCGVLLPLCTCGFSLQGVTRYGVYSVFPL